MNCDLVFKMAVGVMLAAFLGFGCASKPDTLPPLRMASPASSPKEVREALPGTWKIDVTASAEVMARAQFQARETTIIRREGVAPATRETVRMADAFDAAAYREARRYWQDLLSKPDMQWRLTFRADGTGDHYAIIHTGSAPENTPFQWRLDGWRLRVDYPEGAKFKSFEVEMPSAVQLDYPMQPLGDHLVLLRGRR